MDYWWHNIPQHKIGDLVRHPNHINRLLLVIDAKPKKACRVNPVQRVLCVDNKGKERWYEAKALEKMNV